MSEEWKRKVFILYLHHLLFEGDWPYSPFLHYQNDCCGSWSDFQVIVYNIYPSRRVELNSDCLFLFKIKSSLTGFFLCQIRHLWSNSGWRLVIFWRQQKKMLCFCFIWNYWGTGECYCYWLGQSIGQKEIRSWKGDYSVCWDSSFTRQGYIFLQQEYCSKKREYSHSCTWYTEQHQFKPL